MAPYGPRADGNGNDAEKERPETGFGAALEPIVVPEAVYVVRRLLWLLSGSHRPRCASFLEPGSREEGQCGANTDTEAADVAVAWGCR